MTFQGHHKEHADVLAKTVTKLGGKPAVAKAKYDFPVEQLKSQADVLKFAAKLEQGAVSAYLGAVPLFGNRDLAKAAASILGDEAMHWAVLRQALGEAPVPARFHGMRRHRRCAGGLPRRWPPALRARRRRTRRTASRSTRAAWPATRSRATASGRATAACSGAAPAACRASRTRAAMKHSKLTWDEKTLDRFLAKPMKVVPGTAMTYDGVPDAKDRADLIAYLRQGVVGSRVREAVAAGTPGRCV